MTVRRRLDGFDWFVGTISLLVVATIVAAVLLIVKTKNPLPPPPADMQAPAVIQQKYLGQFTNGYGWSVYRFDDPERGVTCYFVRENLACVPTPAGSR